MKLKLYFCWIGVITLAASDICLANVCANINSNADRINYDITKGLAASNNTVGYAFEINKNSDSVIGVNAICPEGTTEDFTYRSYVTSYPITHTVGNVQFIKLNDYLEGGITITDSVAGIYYPPANYVKMGVDGNTVPRHRPFPVRDHDLDFVFRIIKPFVGQVSYSLTPAFQVYVTTKKTDPLVSVVYSIAYSGTITVPQSCALNTGQTITMDFGNIGASAFTQAGAGNKPAGVNPQTRNIAIHCKNIDAQALLSLRIEANKVSGNAIISDNPDLGFIVADGNKNPLTPNNTDSKIPFQLDDKSSASVPFSAWPVSVTGNKPAEGKFTSEGYLRVDFD